MPFRRLPPNALPSPCPPPLLPSASPRATLCAALYVTLCATLCACGPTPTPDWQEKLKACPTDSDIGRLDARDRIELRVYGEDAMTGEYELSPSGTIEFPLLGSLPIQGLRCDEVTLLLKDLLKDRYIVNPFITCLNKNIERTAITVDGQVSQPGTFPFRSRMMLTDAIASAKGRTLRANGSVAIITRKHTIDSPIDSPTDSVVVPYNDIVQGQAPNVCLHPGDFIYVPETKF
jgi:protein involved in polysaccharide export with SLBB domain